MEVMVAVQSGTLLHALRVPLKRRVSARRGGDDNEVPQAIQSLSDPPRGGTGFSINRKGAI